jgi:hypothetical protein
MNLYVDGELEATVNTPGVVNLKNSISTFIGADRMDFNAYFDGLIDEVEVKICPELTSSATPRRAAMPVKSVMPEQAKAKITQNQVYPNPATNTIRVMLTEDVVNLNEIQVVDVFGKLSRPKVRKIEDGVYELNVSTLSQGMYFVKARTASGIKTLKFVKM